MHQKCDKLCTNANRDWSIQDKWHVLDITSYIIRGCIHRVLYQKIHDMFQCIHVPKMWRTVYKCKSRLEHSG